MKVSKLENILFLQKASELFYSDFLPETVNSFRKHPTSPKEKKNK